MVSTLVSVGSSQRFLCWSGWDTPEVSVLVMLGFYLTFLCWSDWGSSLSLFTSQIGGLLRFFVPSQVGVAWGFSAWSL